MEYKKRIIDKKLEFLLETAGAVLIEGPKWSGKTTTAKQISKSILQMDNPQNMINYIKLSELSPSALLNGDVPRLIDEWQIAPKLWDTIRHEIDKRNKMGQFILTGSSTPVDFQTIYHSGIGRIARLKMRTMSLYESNDSDGLVSLENIFNNISIESIQNNLNLERLIFLISRGGWPSSINLKPKAALQQAINYVESLIEVNLDSFDKAKNPSLNRALIKSYARNISTQASLKTIMDDLINNNSTLSRPTLNTYLNNLKSNNVIEEIEAWNPNLRSNTSLRVTPTRMFVDPSIAVAGLGISPEELIFDLRSLGLFFEALCIRDLRIYSENIGGKVYFYRDSNDLEVDAIITLPNGKWGAVEIKLSDNAQDKAASTLKKFVNVVDTKKMNKPSFLMVLTGGNISYQRKDGIYVVSIGSLGP